MTIRSRLALGLLAIAGVLLAPLGLSLRSLERAEAAARDLNTREFAAMQLLADMGVAANDLRRAELALLFLPDSAHLAAVRAELRRLAGVAGALEAHGLREAKDLDAAVRSLDGIAMREFAAARAGRGTLADSISSAEMIPTLERVERAVESAQLALRRRTGERVAVAVEAAAEARRATALALGLAAISALAIAVLLWRAVSGPVQDLEAGMASVADGDLGYRLQISPARRDEFGRLAASFQSMTTQLSELHRLRAEFISVASHEMKTPINVIIGYLQLLNEGIYGPLTQKQRDVLATLESQARALGRLVHQLLDVSRFAAGGARLHLRPIDLEHFLNELEEAFRALALQRGIDFGVERTGTLVREVVWDEDRMNEVLGNLLSNAFKFTEAGGRVELTAEGEDHSVRLTVRDTGPGIDPAELRHIFEKFYQADNQDAAAQRGAGLGLAIAKQIVVAHNGTIDVESELGVGTTFVLTLPVRAGGRLEHQVEPAAAGAPA